MRWLESITDSVDMNLSKLPKILKDREAWCVASMESQRVRHDWATEQQQGPRRLLSCLLSQEEELSLVGQGCLSELLAALLRYPNSKLIRCNCSNPAGLNVKTYISL